MAAKFPSKAMPENFQMTRTPLGTFPLPAKVISRNVAVDASAAVEIQVDVTEDVSRVTQEEINEIPTFLSSNMPKFPYNDIWYSNYEEDTTAANAQIKFLQSVRTGLTVHNASLSDKVGNLTREKVMLMQQNSSLTTKVDDLTRKEAELLLLDTTLSNLSRERDELQQQNTYLTSRLNNLTKENAALTHENNKYHLKLALTNCEDPLATPTPGSASPTSPWSPGCPSTPWTPAPTCTSSPGPTTGTPWSPSNPSCGRTRSQLSSMKNTSPISNIVPLMSIDLDSSMYKAHSEEEVLVCARMPRTIFYQPRCYHALSLSLSNLSANI